MKSLLILIILTTWFTMLLNFILLKIKFNKLNNKRVSIFNFSKALEFGAHPINYIDYILTEVGGDNDRDFNKIKQIKGHLKASIMLLLMFVSELVLYFIVFLSPYR